MITRDFTAILDFTVAPFAAQNVRRMPEDEEIERRQAEAPRREISKWK